MILDLKILIILLLFFQDIHGCSEDLLEKNDKI